MHEQGVVDVNIVSQQGSVIQIADGFVVAAGANVTAPTYIDASACSRLDLFVEFTPSGGSPSQGNVWYDLAASVDGANQFFGFSGSIATVAAGSSATMYHGTNTSFGRNDGGRAPYVALQILNGITSANITVSAWVYCW